MIDLRFNNPVERDKAAVNARGTIGAIHAPDNEPRDPDARLFIGRRSFFRRIGVAIFVHRPPLLVRTMTVNRLYLN
jgi:hypothetical protein